MTLPTPVMTLQSLEGQLPYRNDALISSGANELGSSWKCFNHLAQKIKLRWDLTKSKCGNFTIPRHPIILLDDDWGVQSPIKTIVFRFQYYSQEVSQDP